MTDKQRAPYGAWRSPISVAQVASATSGLSYGHLTIEGRDMYWLETRANEGRRIVIMQRDGAGLLHERTPLPFNVFSRVHEYGGGAYTVAAGTIYFVNLADQRIYRQPPGAEPQPITPAAELRYADLIVDAARGRLICVCEDHRAPGAPVNTLVAIPLDGVGVAETLVAGSDFYAAPRLSPDGSALVWLSWDHPHMPWDSTQLWRAAVGPDGGLSDSRQLAGGPTESIFQPEWAPDGRLYFVSDRSGWWNLYRWEDTGAVPLAPMAAEFGQPQWQFRQTTYAFPSAEQAICVVRQAGQDRLARVDLQRGGLSWIVAPYTEIAYPCAGADRVVCIGGSPTSPAAIVQIGLATDTWAVLHQPRFVWIDRSYLSPPEPIAFPTEDGQTAYGFFYRPRSREYEAPADERPPLLVIGHGGPTAAASSVFSLAIQFWTTRGFAVLDVDYGGSTGYGRAYRERLDGQWGIVDVADCVNGARYLVARGEVDGARLAIRGSSAGGYTTLCALTFHDLFAAGACQAGVSDLEALIHDGHKFESRYLERLVGAYPAERQRYHDRSPIHFIERLSCPLIIFQGLEDRVVPPNQAELMRDALRAKGLPVAYLAFPGEGHGFRRTTTRIRCLEAELSFYAQVFGFTPADLIEPVQVENLSSR